MSRDTRNTRRRGWHRAGACVVILSTAACARTSPPEEEPLPEWCARLPRPENARLDRMPIESEWYVVYAVDPGVFALYEPYQFEEVISYLITGDDRALLFDTGLGIAPIRPLVERLSDLPMTVVNSHTHPDHVAGNADFERVLGTSTDFTSRNTEGVSHEAVAEILAREALCRPLPAAFDSASYRIRPFEISEIVQDGQVIDLGSRLLEVLMTPGHTPDALMLLDRANGLLFTGDTFYEGPIYVMTDEADFDRYRASIERVAPLAAGLRKLLPGHNVAVSTPGRLGALATAVHALGVGDVLPARSQNGVKEFAFDAFSILVPDSIGAPIN